jgi:hypothetical protein
VQDLEDGGRGRLPPERLAGVFAPDLMARQEQSTAAEEAHDPLRGAEGAEALEDEPDLGLDRLIGVEEHAPALVAHVAGGHGLDEFAAARLLEPPRIHALAQQMEFGLAQGALESQEQAIIVVPRVVDSLGVGQKRAEERT